MEDGLAKAIDIEKFIKLCSGNFISNTQNSSHI